MTEPARRGLRVAPVRRDQEHTPTELGAVERVQQEPDLVAWETSRRRQQLRRLIRRRPR